MSKHRKPNTPRAPRFPDRTTLSKHQSIRSILALGRSHGVTLPAEWLRSVYDPARPFLVATVNNDGTCTLASLATLTPTTTDPAAPHPHHRLARPAKRKTST